MKKQTQLFAALLFSCVIALPPAASADGRTFGRFTGRSAWSPSAGGQARQSLANRNNTSTTAGAAAEKPVLSPERLRKMYGISILVRPSLGTDRVGDGVVFQP